MARGYLKLSDVDFWDMAPKCLFAMVAQWREIEEYNIKVQKYVNDGGILESRTVDDEPEYVDVHPDAF